MQDEIRLYNGNCVEVLRQFDEECVDLVVTSPPYDDLRNYDNTCAWNFEIFKDVADELYRVVAKGGCVVWVVADKTNKGSESGTSFKHALYFKEIGFNLHDTMIYKKLNYVPLTHNRYEQEFEFMFVFSKGKPKTFNPIKVPCKYAGSETRSSFYKTSGDELTPTGKRKVAQDKIKGNVFEYNTGASTGSGEYKHPAMFPLQLATDQVISWSNENDTVLDPFMGSGTTGVACAKLKRKFIGVELVEKYFNIAKDRLWGDAELCTEL